MPKVHQPLRRIGLRRRIGEIVNCLIPARVQVAGKENVWAANAERGIAAGRKFDLKVMTFPDDFDLSEVVVVTTRDPLTESKIKTLSRGDTVMLTCEVGTFDRAFKYTVLDVEVLPGRPAANVAK